MIIYDGVCEVHALFTGEKVLSWKKRAKEAGINLQVLSHPECAADVLEESDIIGSSEVLIRESIRLGQEGMTDIMLITECGTADWVMAETKDELNIMHANLADPDGNGICCGYNGTPTPDPNNLGGFDGTASYWSSSESTNSEAYYQHFGNGFVTDMLKAFTFP